MELISRGLVLVFAIGIAGAAFAFLLTLVDYVRTLSEKPSPNMRDGSAPES